MQSDGNSFCGDVVLGSFITEYRGKNAFEATYSVTQSFANSFWGYVVLDSFNNVSRDEDNILDQIYIKQICPDFYHDDFWFS